MVRETVAIETLARAATVRMSGLLETVVRLPFRLTNSCYFVFFPAGKKEKPLWNIGSIYWSHGRFFGGSGDMPERQ